MRSRATTIGSLRLPGLVMTASGTAGHGDELASYGDLSKLGALVIKSLSPEPWEGNPGPRVKAVDDGMLNSVGLQGPGIPEWIANDLPKARATASVVVASVWGRSIAEFALAGQLLAGADIDAIEVNVSCPNLEDRSNMFAHSPEATHAAVAAVGDAHPRWAKLSPNTSHLVDVAGAALDAGAEALTLTNTVLGMVIDVETRSLALGGGGGGLSGPAIHPVAVRAVYECHRAHPNASIIGVGGVRNARTAVEMIMAGASAVQVGTAALAEPRALWRVQDEINAWLDEHKIGEIEEIRGAAHGN